MIHIHSFWGWELNKSFLSITAVVFLKNIFALPRTLSNCIFKLWEQFLILLDCSSSQILSLFKNASPVSFADSCLLLSEACISLYFLLSQFWISLASTSLEYLSSAEMAPQPSPTQHPEWLSRRGDPSPWTSCPGCYPKPEISSPHH